MATHRNTIETIVQDRYRNRGGFTTFNKNVREAREGVSGLSGNVRSLSRFAAPTAIAATLGTIAVSGYRAAAEVARLEAQLNILTRNPAATGRIFAEARELASDIGVPLQEIVEGYRLLNALGLDPAVSELESYANTARAMGKTVDDYVQAVADAVVGENERLKEFGIKARKHGNEVKFTFQGVTTVIGNSAAEIKEYLTNIGFEQFSGAAKVAAETTGGRMDSLLTSVKNLSAAMYQAFGIDGAINSGLEKAKNVADEATKNLNGQFSLEKFERDLASAHAQLVEVKAATAGFGFAANSAVGDIESNIARINGAIKGFGYERLSTALEGIKKAREELETGPRASEAENEAIEKQIDALNKLLEKQKQLTHVQKARIELEGRLKNVADAKKSELLQAAAAVDANVAAKEAAKQKAIEEKKAADELARQRKELEAAAKLRADSIAEAQAVLTQFTAANDTLYAAAQLRDERLQALSTVFSGGPSAKLDEFQNYYEQRNAIIESYEQAAFEIEQKRAEKQRVLEQSRRTEALQIAGNLFGALADITGKGSKKAFERSKKLSLAQTAVTTLSAAQNAFASQLIPGDPTSLGRAYAAAAAATLAGLARFRSIQNQQYSGGSGIGGSGGGGSGSSGGYTPPDSFGASSGGNQTSVNVYVQGDVIDTEGLRVAIVQGVNEGFQRGELRISEDQIELMDVA